MSDQLAIDFAAPPMHAAIVMGETGMQRAAERAEREVPGFGDLSYAYLVAWLHWRSVGEAFSAEAVTEDARRDGVQFADGRAWGSAFSRAAREGLIRRSTVLFRRARGHGTQAPGWVRVR